ncbi:MAG: hypothetical protein PHQ96_03670 [Candidatus Omnitrophica bacterium]|nr:hypothetical protein [Candidatus Omnitrophota bacterium]
MPNKNIDLSALSKEELLNLRICDLPLKIEGTWIADCISKLYAELDNKKIKFKPACYLADEWLAPDEEPVVGIPFFLAHPSLVCLEQDNMFEVEGGTQEWCMKLLRHETGHAINYAYRFYKRAKWRKIFGPFSKEYRDTYRFRPYSRSFVRHLEDYYAQYHPDEDFAETFAVWLTPDSQWERLYKGWRALRKLRYIEDLSKELRNSKPQITRGKKYWRFSSLRVTLKNYYKRKRIFKAEDFPDFHDSNLKKIFVEQHKNLFSQPADELIKKHRRHIVNCVARWTGENKYITNEIMDKVQKRIAALHLVLAKSESAAVAETSVYVSTLVMNYIHTGRFKTRMPANKRTNDHE